MYTMKNNDPNMEPSGTLEVPVNQSEASPFTTTYCWHYVS